MIRTYKLSKTKGKDGVREFISIPVFYQVSEHWRVGKIIDLDIGSMQAEFEEAISDVKGEASRIH